MDPETTKTLLGLMSNSLGWHHVMAIFAANICIFLSMFGITNGWRKEAKDDLMSFRTETSMILKAIQDEMKDFHERLSPINKKEKVKEGE